MKNLLTACVVIVSAFTIHASAGDNTKAKNDRMNLSAYHFKDTVPKDTTKKDTMFSAAVAYRIVKDTVPSDTTKKDTSFQALAFNR